MMKKIVSTVFFLSLALLAAALVAPGFINWNEHKSQIVKRLQPYIQRKIDVAGDVSFRILPNPQILLSDVAIENKKDGEKSGKPLMTLKRLEARMKLEPLLEGRFEVDTVNLVQPELNLEVEKDGTANWGGVFKTPKNGNQNSLTETADAVQLNQVTVSGGVLHYANDNTGLAWQVNDVNFSVAADTLFGPYRVAGTMQYKNYEVNVDMGTGKYEAGSPVPVHATFIPVEGLPQIKLNGVVDLTAGIDMQGDLEMQNGSLGSLFDSAFLKGLAFMNDTADLTASLDFKGGTAQLSDIKARFGRVKDGKAAGGEITGSLSAQMTRNAQPVVTADLTGSYVRLSPGSAFLPAPDRFDAHLKLKGTHVVWDGVDIPSASINADSSAGEWTVKEARFNLPGHSVAKLAGVVTPKSNYAAYSMQLTTDDLPRFIGAVSPSAGNILAAMADTPLVKKLNFSSSMDLKADKISLFDINAVADDKTKISGVLNVSRSAGKPDFQAHLNLSGLNMDSLSGDVRHDTVNALMAGTGTLDLNVSDLTDGALKVATLSFKGKTDDAGLHIAAMNAVLADGGALHLDGRIASMHPAKGIDLNYAVKSAGMADILKAADMGMPPLLPRDARLDIQGKIQGDDSEPHFTLSGKSGSDTIKMEGVIHTDAADKPDVYEGSVHLTNADGTGAWSSLGLPVDALIGRAGGFELDGAVSGSAASYKVSDLTAKQGGDTVTGSLAVEDGKMSGKLAADTIDADHWLSSGWSVKTPTDLHLTGKKLVLYGNDISAPQFDLHADAKGAQITDLKGDLWGGDLTAAVSAEKQAAGWKNSVSGSLKNANVQQLALRLGLDKGVSFARGDIGFDLASETKGHRNSLKDMSGKLTVSAGQLTVRDFSLSALPGLVTSLSAPPEFLSDMVRKSIRSNGDTVYNDVTASLKVSDGKFTIDHMALTNADALLDVGGDYAVSSRRYNLRAKTQMTRPNGMPAFTVSRSGVMGASADNIVSIKPISDYISAHAPKEAPTVPETVKTPTAVEQHAAGEQRAVDGQPVENAQKGGLTPEESQPMAGGTGAVDPAPIETEPLAAPPAQNDGADTSKPGDGIKGILERLDETP
jgi:uncharacterized protein involved in outer membrane biogenesis